MFRALVIMNDEAGYRAALSVEDESRLPEGDVTVRLRYSCLNYKDALAITGAGPVVRAFPMTPGIDGAGRIEVSADPRFKEGDEVFVNGFGVGERHWGCLAEKARLRSDWLLPLPALWTSRQVMAVGTAGYTAMLCVQALERHGARPDQGDVLVTGAAGGVGSLAVHILARRGFRVVASTGRPEEADYLHALGAAEIMDRSLLAAPGKPLARERWAGAVDVVGGHTLANVCAQMRYGGVAAACGLVQGMDFPATVAPFVLRGVTLVGIDSVMCPMPRRREAWDELARTLDPALLERATTEIGLSEVQTRAAAFMKGAVRGRIVVDVNR